MLKKLTYIFILFFCYHSIALSMTNTNETISLDVDHIEMRNALHLIADRMSMNIIVSHAVTGNVTLHLKNVSAPNMFDLLLRTHDLAKIPLGKIWFITPRNSWLQREQDNLKLQDIIDMNAPLVAHVWHIQYAKVDDIAHLLQDANHSMLSKRGHIHIDLRTNILYIQDTQKQLAQIQLLIKQVDVPVQQVLIDTHLASVDSDFERNLGVRFSVLSNSNSASDMNSINPSYSLLVAKLADGDLLDMKLHALEQAGHAELISNPHLFTANQQSASIEAGEEIPYQEISRSGATGVAFKKAVLSLKVIPQVLPNHKVLLQLQLNQDKPSSRMVLGVPAITTRQISTNVLVRSGETIVLGGIYEINREQAKQSIPFLGKIPLLGLLFQQRDNRENKRELLIFVMPKIIPQDTG